MPTIYSLLENKEKSKSIAIHRVKDFFELSLKLMEDDKIIYRGINSNSQKYPKLIRERDYSKHESSLLQEFEKYYGLYSRVPNFWEFISLAQHHGLMTRLIDFSSNIFVAAFFSLCRKSKTGEYKIYVFNKQNLVDSDKWAGDSKYLSEPDERLADNVTIAFDHFGMTGSDYILMPYYSNNRLFVQQGLFVIPGVVTINHIDKLYNHANLVINISPRIRKHILNRIERLGYNEYRLMPDLDSVCSEINNCHKK